MFALTSVRCAPLHTLVKSSILSFYFRKERFLTIDFFFALARGGQTKIANMQQPQQVPVTIISGFLGAGKVCFCRNHTFCQMTDIHHTLCNFQMFEFKIASSVLFLSIHTQYQITHRSLSDRRLLNYVLTANHGKRIAVIENEFGEGTVS